MAELLEKLALVNVVVIGDMNPAIHRPEWYVQQQILPAGAVQAALDSKDFVFAPPVSQFSYDGLMFVCELNRWEIRSSDWDQRARVVALAQHTFDVLRHTPVIAVGFNLEREVGIDPVLPRLSEMLERANLGFGPPAERLQIAHTRGWKNRSVTLAIRSPGSVTSSAHVAVNVNHDVRPSDASKTLAHAMGELSEDVEEAQNTWNAAATALKRLGGDQ